LTGIVADGRLGWTGWTGWAGWAGRTGWARQVAGALLGAAAAAEALARGAAAGWGLTSVLALAILALCTTVPLAFLGPVAAAVCVCLASVLSLAAFRTLTVAGLVAGLIALYRLGQGARRAEQMLAPALAVPFLIVALLDAHQGTEDGVLAVLLAALAPAAALAGIAERARQQARMHVAARQAIADTLVEHTARGERARIARELHDVVAHHISMIAVQAETARLATPGMPAAGAQRLLEIGDTARAGLTEMRRLLGVLREDARAADPAAQVARAAPAAPAARAAGSADWAPWSTDRRPQPGLEQLNELLDEAREASNAGTRLIVSGPPAMLDPGVELAAYRIVQEALTNSRRHAPGAAVDVELRFGDGALLLRIRDNGPGPPGSADRGSGGHGLSGMRERAAAAGGELSTGAAPGGGFLVEAILPAEAGATGWRSDGATGDGVTG
jgi:signal transduction histidine kinase